MQTVGRDNYRLTCAAAAHVDRLSMCGWERGSPYLNLSFRRKENKQEMRESGRRGKGEFHNCPVRMADVFQFLLQGDLEGEWRALLLSGKSKAEDEENGVLRSMRDVLDFVR